MEIYALLKEEGLEAFYLPFQTKLHVKKIHDFKNVRRTDLSRIGIVSGPDLKRFAKVHERASRPNGIKDFLQKVFKSKPKAVSLPYTAAFQQTEPVIIKVGDIIIGKELGKGQFGTVNEGTWIRKVAGERVEIPVAIKSLGGHFGLNEVSNLTALDQNHDNIIKFYGIIVDGDSPFKMVTEFALLGSLSSKLENGDIKSISMLSQFAVQIAAGMLYLESKNLVHRDLAARNILVMAYNQVKISDFGLSKLLNSKKEWIMDTEEILPIRWLAPECLLEGKFTVASDVWSYGVTLWEMFSLGAMPWENLSSDETIGNITKGIRLEEPPFCPRYFYSYILNKCWQFKAEDRSSFQQIQEQMTWLQPTTGIASTHQVDPEFLQFQVNDLVTAIKPVGNSADLWLGQNESTDEIGTFQKSLTHPIEGKGFEHIHDGVYRKLIPDTDVLFHQDQEGYSSDSEYSSLERKRAQTHNAAMRAKGADKYNQPRPLSDGQLLDKMQELIDQGYYDIPKPIFDDEDEYVTMKEFLEEDTVNVESSGGQNGDDSTSPTSSTNAIEANSQTVDANIASAPTKLTDVPRLKPVPPPKPKRSFDKELRPLSSSDSIITTTNHIPIVVESGKTVVTSNAMASEKQGHPNNDIDEVSNSISKDESPGGNTASPIHNELELATAQITDGYARTAEIHQNQPTSHEKAQRSFSKLGINVLMSTLDISSSLRFEGLNESEDSNKTFIKRVSPQSTLTGNEKSQLQLTKYISEGYYDVPKRLRESGHYTEVKREDSGEYEEIIDREETMTMSKDETTDPKTNDTREHVTYYSQESGRYDLPRLYEASWSGEVLENAVVHPPLLKPRTTAQNHQGISHYQTPDIKTSSAKTDKQVEDNQVRDSVQHHSSKEGKSEDHIKMRNRYSQPDYKVDDNGKEARIHSYGELSHLDVHEERRERSKSFESALILSPSHENKPPSPTDYQSYKAIYLGTSDQNKKQWLPASSPASHPPSASRKLTKKNSKSKVSEESAASSWEPTLVKEGANTTKDSSSKYGIKLPLTKKRSRKSTESSSTKREPIITVEQLPKLLSWLHKSIPELAGTTHSELYGALELTKGSIDEAIHYLKYRRVLKCGISVSADMALDALEQSNWDIREAIKCATLMYIVYRFPHVDMDYCHHLLKDLDWQPENLIRKLTVDIFVQACEDIGVAEDEAQVALRFAKGDTEKAIKILKARRVSEIVGKPEEYCWTILSKNEWDTDRAIVFILNSS